MQSENDIPTVRPSSLLGYDYQLVGFSFCPTGPGDGLGETLQWTIFAQLADTSLFVLCGSSHPGPVPAAYYDELTDSLGWVVPAEQVVPYAHRLMGGSFPRVQEILNTVKLGEIRWIESDKLIDPATYRKRGP